jgi:transcriptional regulator with XRE-family HTH domain
MDLMQLGKLLAEARIRSGLSQRSAAKSAGISAAYVRTLEIGRNPKTGQASKPAQDKLRRLCGVVGLDLERALPLAGYDSAAAAETQPEDDVPARVAVERLFRELHEAAKGLSQRNAFLQTQIVDRLSGFAEDFGAMTSGTIRYSADQEPLLTQTAIAQTKRQISAVSYQDEEWWLGPKGQNYLQAHDEALSRGIKITRIFLVPLDKQGALEGIFQRHLDLEIETFVLAADEVNDLLRSDFVVYDDQLLRTGRPLPTPSEWKSAVFTDDKALIRQALKDFRELRKLAVARGADVESVLGRLR